MHLGALGEWAKCQPLGKILATRLSRADFMGGPPASSLARVWPWRRGLWAGAGLQLQLASAWA